MADVETAVAGVTNLPEGADDPEIERGGWGDRVTDVVIWGPVGVEQLGRYADEFVAALYRAGITRTTIQGIADPLIRIEVPEAALIRHGIGLREVADVVAAGTVGAPAGEVTGDSTRLRAGSERREAEAIGALPVRTDADGGQLLVRDVALVTAEGADSGRAYFRDGHPAVSIRVDRSDQGDAIAMQRDVRTVAATLAETLPEGVEIELVRTRAEAITDRLDLLLTNGLMGLALVVGLLFLFLNARTAFWVAAGIPVAMTAAIGLMYLSGLTLNMISLFGLILCLGLVVDDAIVVAEHADWRFRRLGEAPAVAAESAARVMALPVFSAMVTTVLAFFGLTHDRGTVRRDDRRHPVHGDRGADREPRGVLPDPAASHGRCAGRAGAAEDRELDALARPAEPGRQPRARRLSRPGLRAADGLGDPAALSGDRGGGVCWWRARARCSCAAT